MADESRRYPPTERKLARLWEAGVTPASPALVAGAVLVASALLGLVAGRSLAGWLASCARALPRPARRRPRWTSARR